MSEPDFKILPDGAEVFTVLPDGGGQFTVQAYENTFVVDVSVFEARKHPSAELPFIIDWGQWLDARGGESIDSVVWTISGPDVLLTESSNGGTARKKTIYLAGGTGEAVYEISALIVTSGSPSMMDERTLNLTIESALAVAGVMTVTDFDGTVYLVPLRVLDFDGTSYTVTKSVSDFDGTVYEVI